MNVSSSLKLASIFWLITIQLQAAGITLLDPSAYCVFQRGPDNSAEIPIHALLERPAQHIEVEAQLVAPSHDGIDGHALSFQDIGKSDALEFSGKIKIPAGGWYALHVRAMDFDRKLIGEATVEKVGVGEVFFCAGHSYCSACNGSAPTHSADDRVATVGKNPEGPTFRHCDDPLPPADGGRATPWPGMGDLLVARLHVPVLLVCCGKGGATAKGWRESTENPETAKGPYGIFYKTARQLVPKTGIRAVIWFGNANDMGWAPTATQHAENLRVLINKSREHLALPSLPWLLAFDADYPSFSRRNGEEKTKSRANELDRGTREIIAAGGNVFEGPQSDDLRENFRLGDFDHFNDLGLAELSKRFAEKVMAAFFQKEKSQRIGVGAAH